MKFWRLGSLAVFFLAAALCAFIVAGCSPFLSGYKVGQTKEFREKISKAEAGLRRAEKRAETFKRFYEEAKEKGLGSELVAEFAEEAKAASEDVSAITEEITDLYAIAEKGIEGNGFWAWAGLAFSGLLNIGLGYLGGGKGKAILSLVQTIESFSLSDEDKGKLRKKQEKSGVHGHVAKAIKIMDKKNGKAA